MPAVEHPHEECPDCRFFNPLRLSRKCRGCGIGENFEEIIQELDPERDTIHMPSKSYDDE